MALWSRWRLGSPSERTRAVALAFSAAVSVAALFEIDNSLPAPRVTAAYAAIVLMMALTLVIFIRKQGLWVGSAGSGPLVVVGAQAFANHSVSIPLALAALACPVMYGSRAMSLVRIIGVAAAIPVLAVGEHRFYGQPVAGVGEILIPVLVIVAFGALIRFLLNASLIQEESDLRQSLLEAISAARDEAVAASAAKGAFLGMMSHELRTPLNAVIGMADLALSTPLDAAQQDLITTIASSGQKLLKIIDNILDFSQIEAGRTRLAEEAFDLGVLVRDTAESFAGRRPMLGLSVDIDEAVQTAVLGDPDHLRKILSNLIDNALKFTTEGAVTRARSFSCHGVVTL